MAFAIAISPHGHNQNRTSHVMRWTCIALLPALGVQYVLFGWGILFQLAIAILSALFGETMVLLIRRRPVGTVLKDTSAILTAILIAVAIPSYLPAWMTVTATLFAIVIAKQLYGGLGQNIFNPAMVAYVFLLISFPAAMTSWSVPVPMREHQLDIHATAQLILKGQTQSGLKMQAMSDLADGSTMATPLDHIKTEQHRGTKISQVLADPRLQSISHDGWRWLNLAFLAGGIFLWLLRIIPWQTPLGMLAVLAGCSALAHWIAPELYVPVPVELLSGATMLGAFFIVTDPVTSCTTARGRLLFGGLVGLIVFVIRHFGGYPDGVAFAVLLCNILVPMLDRWTQSRVYGY